MNAYLTGIDLAALSPLLLLLGGALILLLVESFAGSKKLPPIIAFVTIASAMVCIWAAPGSDNERLTPWLRFDSLARLFAFLFLTIGLFSVCLAQAFFEQFEPGQGEYYFLLISALFGLILIASAADFLTLFLGLETLSLSLYVMCGYMKNWSISHESALKYFLLSSIAAAFLLYGIALIYGATGTTNLARLLPSYKMMAEAPKEVLFAGGVALVTMGFLFKAAIVPFHIWAPDVYEGASTPVTAFMAVGTKMGAFAALVILFLTALRGFDPIWNQAIALFAYPTLIYANAVAIRQTQMRRFFAYSGMAQAGFMLIPLAAETPESTAALTFYLIIYSLATLGSFAILTVLDKNEEGVILKDLNGLFFRSPYLAALLAICLLTLAGIPPTAGFFAKFFVLKLAFQAGYYGLVVVGLLTSILAAFYYLRVAAVMFTEEPKEKSVLAVSWPAYLAGFLCLALIIALSIYPSPLMKWIASLTTPLA